MLNWQDSLACQIKLSQIITKEQVRKSFDPEKHQEIVASINEHGQQQPIRVYWSDDDQKWVVLMGHRRLRAAMNSKCKLEKIDCVTHPEKPSENEIIQLQLIENIIREDLNPVDEARRFQAIIDSSDLTAQASSDFREFSIKRITLTVFFPARFPHPFAQFDICD